MSAVHHLKPKTKTSFKDEDGDDSEPTESINIRSVDNGWMITTVFEDGSEVIEVFNTDGKDNGNIEAIKCVIESMGIEHEAKLK